MLELLEPTLSSAIVIIYIDHSKKSPSQVVKNSTIAGAKFSMPKPLIRNSGVTGIEYLREENIGIG